MSCWVITGANGNLGRRLIARLLEESADTTIKALVRSQAAAERIASALTIQNGDQTRFSTEVVDYTDATGLLRAFEGASQVVHLVGILKESSNSSYAAAHEDSCNALREALAGTTGVHVTYLSIVGSRADAENACLASKGAAEEILRGSDEFTSCILRVPMVLGEGDYASFALQRRALQRISFSFRHHSLEQPIYAGDVVEAIVAAGIRSYDGVLDVGGPEVLTRKALTQRAAGVLGARTMPVSLPLAVGRLIAVIMQSLSKNPPLTLPMLEVLDHDDRVDPSEAMTALGLKALTPLDEMLSRVFA